jgi:hypothetical protein
MQSEVIGYRAPSGNVFFCGHTPPTDLKINYPTHKRFAKGKVDGRGGNLIYLYRTTGGGQVVSGFKAFTQGWWEHARLQGVDRFSLL